MTDIADDATDAGKTIIDNAVDGAAEAARDIEKAAPGHKSFFDQAREMAEHAIETSVEAVKEAVDTSVEAAKEHPVAAAAIAAGAAAAVAGAAYGANRLMGDDAPTKKK